MPTILIVDDSEMSRMLISAIVNEAYPDAEIIEAEDGDDALRKSAGRTVDYATVDMNMPGLDAFEAIERLRLSSPSAKIGLLTANAQQAVQQKAEALGVRFIPKPLEPQHLMAFLLGLE